MILIRILRFLFGCTYFSVTGGFKERFFALCAERKISLSDIENTDDGISAVVYGTSTGKLLDCAGQAGMNIVITGKSGLPQIFKRYRYRLGIPVGLLVSFVLFSLWSSVIWSVDIKGSEKIPEAVILSFFEERGVRRGVFRSSVDCDALEDALMENMPLLSWASVNIKGCRAEIEVTERIIAPEIFDESRYVNIIASRDGEILSADVFAGKGSAKVGLPVQKGDLLVSGVVTMKNGVRFVHSRAEIIARTSYDISCSQSKISIFNTVQKERNIYSLYLFGVRIPLGFMKNSNSSYISEYIMSAGNTQFPVSIIRKRCTLTEEQEVELTDRQASLLCAAKYPITEALQLNADEIETRTIEAENNDSAIIMTGSCYCHEDIALEQVFEVEIAK